jgi:phosphotransferase system enzyme I (PtsI)
MKKIYGLGLSPGIVIGKVLILKNNLLGDPEHTISKNKISSEIERFLSAKKEAEKEILKKQEELKETAGNKYADIFYFHLSLLNDPFFIEKTKDIITKELVNTETALKKVLENISYEFKKSSEDLMKDKRIDMSDVIERIIVKLNKTDVMKIKKQKEEIIVAHDLAPSQTVSLDKKYVIGFITEVGSVTSHTAILAKALEIPAIVAKEKVTELLQDGDSVIIDTNEGIIIQNPSASTIQKYKRKQKELVLKNKQLSFLKNLLGKTKDGRSIKLQANIELPEEIETAEKYGAEGIGLYRTEYLYLNRKDLPCEEEQFLAYKKVCGKTQENDIIIRTLDIGGDKFLSKSPYPKELNPFLGWRGIRFCLERLDIFETQLRAILRAAACGNLKIMFPMVSTIEEIIQSKEILQKVKKDLKKEKVDFNSDIDVGVMIEVPSAALISYRLAKEVDFFSIGSNDLVQYTLAADRGNSKIAHLYQPCHPAVLHLIKLTIKNALKEGIWTGICGEMASIPEIACLLAGLGAVEFSMAPVAIPAVKDRLRQFDYSYLKSIAKEIEVFDNHSDVYNYLQKKFK